MVLKGSSRVLQLVVQESGIEACSISSSTLLMMLIYLTAEPKQLAQHCPAGRQQGAAVGRPEVWQLMPVSET